ncbi:amidohydrolase, partial [Rhizobium ruizarguesonis]
MRYPWLSGVTALDHDFLYETYASVARRCGITTALHMEVVVVPAAMQAVTNLVAGIANK